MGFAPGEVIRLNENAGVPSFARGRLCCVKDVIVAKNGKTLYAVQMMHSLFTVPEAGIECSADKTIH